MSEGADNPPTQVMHGRAGLGSMSCIHESPRMRAAEYRIPIFVVANSACLQIVDGETQLPPLGLQRRPLCVDSGQGLWS